MRKIFSAYFAVIVWFYRCKNIFKADLLILNDHLPIPIIFVAPRKWFSAKYPVVWHGSLMRPEVTPLARSPSLGS
jgi:hypothetical protein